MGRVLAKKIPVSARFEEDIFYRLHEVAKHVSARANGIQIPRNTAMCIAIERGLESLEKEFGIDPEARTRQLAAEAATARRSGT